MRILLAAAEAFPLAKEGGLGDVVFSLSLALQDLGHEVYLVLPKYGSIKAAVQDVGKSFAIQLGGYSHTVVLKKTTVKERMPVYLVENEHYFGGQEIYGENDLERFLFFSLTIPEVVSQLNPDVIHCHDWHTALALLWLKKAKMRLPSVFTIHNLAYQGRFDGRFLYNFGLSQVWGEFVPPGAPKAGLNFISQGILLADVITTVSPTYAREILTPECGEGLQQLLNYRRSQLYGILNGIDYDEYDPATDPFLERNYDSTKLEDRKRNKVALQRKSGLPQDVSIPLCGMVTRLEEQKGIDLLLRCLDLFVEQTACQLVILGQGREHYHQLLCHAAKRYPRRIAVFLEKSEHLGRLVYAGCDIFLMPSRFEPCGLGQLIAMRYGAVPVVRRTGGLADTVKDVAEENGNGFVFENYDAGSMLRAIKRAEEMFRSEQEWRRLMKRNMELDFSWKRSAQRYHELYLEIRKASRN
jgi:starch synthase